jgi:hypothetical protein
MACSQCEVEEKEDRCVLRHVGGLRCHPATAAVPRPKLVSIFFWDRLPGSLRQPHVCQCLPAGGKSRHTRCARAVQGAGSCLRTDEAATCNPSLRPANHGSSDHHTLYPSCPGNSATLEQGRKRVWLAKEEIRKRVGRTCLEAILEPHQARIRKRS